MTHPIPTAETYASEPVRFPPVGLSARRTVLRLVSVASLLGAVAWLPVSATLAGNLTLNSDESRGDAWLVLSIAIAVAVLGALTWALAASFVAICRDRRRVK